MDISLYDFLNNIRADDYFFVNIKCGRERLYLGYNNEVPDDLLNRIISDVYIDWGSEALGINLL